MLRLRQVALVARDLDSAEDEIERSLGSPVCFRDPGVGEFGLHNALFALGDQFVEVVSPTVDGTTAGRLLGRRGDGGYMAIFQVDSLDHVADRLDGHGIRIVFDARGEGIRGLHLHPTDIGGAIVSIDACDEDAEWPWAGQAWRDRASTDVTGIAGITVSVEDPDTVCRQWCAALGVDPAPDGRSLTTDDALVRFDHAVGDRFGITALQVSTDAATTRVLPDAMVGVDLST